MEEENNGKRVEKQRILTYSNSVMSNSGFGTVVKNLLMRLTPEYDTFSIGIEHLTAQLKYKGINCLPTGYNANIGGAEIIPEYLEMFKPKYFITCTDLHQLGFFDVKEGWIKYVTIDASPIHHGFHEVLRKGYLNVVPNRFSYDELVGLDIPVKYIPFGVNADVYRPKKGREFTGLKGKFIFGCYDEDTEILTKNGFKYFEELKVGEEVFTLSKERNLELQTVSETYEYNYEGEMIWFNSSTLDLLVTPDHRMLTENQQGQMKFMQAEDVKGGRKIPKTCNWKGTEKDFFEVAGRQIPMDLWLQFFGIWIAEGYTTWNSPGYNIGITQINEMKREMICEMLEKMPFHFWETKNSFIMSNKLLFRYLEQFGKSREKFIPEELKSLSGRQLRILLDWYTLGDGRHVADEKAEHWEIITSSERLVSDVHEIALKLGYYAYSFIVPQEEKFIRATGRRIKARGDIWRVAINTRSKRFAISSDMIKKTKYKGKIYDCTVPNHTLYVRRFGRCVWSGNCVGRNTERKRWDRLLRAFAAIWEECRDAVLVCYTDPREQLDYAFDAQTLAKDLGIGSKVFFPSNTSMQRAGLTDEHMSEIYNAFDVHVNVADREGFGLPILESMSCGVPNIVNNYSAPPEIVGDAGIKVDPSDWAYHSPFNYKGALISIEKLAEVMRILHDDRRLRNKLGRESRKRAMEYDWDVKIIPQWKELLGSEFLQEL